MCIISNLYLPVPYILKLRIANRNGTVLFFRTFASIAKIHKSLSKQLDPNTNFWTFDVV